MLVVVGEVYYMKREYVYLLLLFGKIMNIRHFLGGCLLNIRLKAFALLLGKKITFFLLQVNALKQILERLIKYLNTIGNQLHFWFIWPIEDYLLYFLDEWYRIVGF